MKFEDIPNASEIIKPIDEPKEPKELKILPWLEEYEKLLKNEIVKCVNDMIKNENTKSVLDIQLKSFLKVKVEDKDKGIPIHVLHYGYNFNKKWTIRRNVLSDKNEKMPFQKLQDQMLEKGYYLLDESDPSKSFSTHLVLYSVKPHYYGNSDLWHGLNVIKT